MHAWTSEAPTYCPLQKIAPSGASHCTLQPPSSLAKHMKSQSKLICVVHPPLQHVVQCSWQLLGGTLHASLQCMSHWAWAVVTQSEVGCFILQMSVVGWSHSAWQPTKQSRCAGSHWATHWVPQVSVHDVMALA